MKLFVFDKFSAAAVTLTVVFGVAAAFYSAVSVPVYTSGGSNLPIYRVKTDENAVAVTFDTAWGNEDINSVLSALSAASCKATFFVTGEWAEKFPDDVKKIYESGHEIASHTNEHKHFSALTPDEMLNDMEICDAKIRNITAQDEILVRAPYGEYNSDMVNVCRSTGRYLIQWSLDSLDYKDLSLPQIEKRILPKLGGGDILLFHTGTKHTAEYLPQILADIKAKGFSFRKCGELIYKDNFSLENDGRQIPSPTVQ